MRWRSPKNGDRRVRGGFIFVPRWVAGEWRWLESARWIEVYRPVGRRGKLDWDPDRWVDTPDDLLPPTSPSPKVS